jgi:hypothetical protein
VLRNALCSRTPVVQPSLVTATKGFRHGYSPALVNASTQMQQRQVAQTAQVLVLKKAMGIHQAAGQWRCYRPSRWPRVSTWALRSTRWRRPLTGWQRNQTATSARFREVQQSSNFGSLDSRWQSNFCLLEILQCVIHPMPMEGMCHPPLFQWGYRPDFRTPKSSNQSTEKYQGLR